MILTIFKSNEKIGLKLLQSNFVSILNLGTSFATLNMSGKIHVSKDLFINFASGKEVLVYH